MASTCLVSAKDFKEHWQGKRGQKLKTVAAAYTGPERRQNAHDRRWFAGQGGRRKTDRKS